MFPEKLYAGIPTSASMLKLEFDFYEIDSWDDEVFAVYINNAGILLGYFNHILDEGTQVGSVGDVRVEIQSLGPPLDLGFNPHFGDQIHHVTIYLPR